MAFSVVSHWFRIRRGLALGFVTLGAAVGGIFFSLVLRAVFSRFTWKKSILVLSATISVLMGVGNLLVKSKTSVTRGAERDGTTHCLDCFRSVKFWLVCYSVFGTIIDLSLPSLETRSVLTLTLFRSPTVHELLLFVQWGSIPAYSVFTGLGDQFSLMVVYTV
jgi:MFS family permease